MSYQLTAYRLARLHCYAISLLFIVASSCQTDPVRDVRDFYLPVRRLAGGLVYEFSPVNRAGQPPVYWYYRSVETDTALYLTTNYYTADYQPQQLITEELTNGGMVLRELRLYELDDSTGRMEAVQADIVAGNLFPFRINTVDPAVYLYKVAFQLPSQRPHTTTTLIVNRQYAGDTTFRYRETDYEALRLQLKGVVELRDTVRGGMEPTFVGEEIYAQGLGLVEYWRRIGPDTLHYRLTDQFSMAELERRAKLALPQE